MGIAAAHCPVCPPDAADVELDEDPMGFLRSLWLECRVCGHVWILRPSTYPSLMEEST